MNKKVFTFINEDLMDHNYSKPKEKKIEVDMDSQAELMRALRSKGKFSTWSLVIKDQRIIQKRLVELMDAEAREFKQS